MRVPSGPSRQALALAGVLAAQGIVFAQVVPAAASSNYDEGTYLASADALRHGQPLGGEIFTSQPPGWYYLLAGVQSVAGRSVEAHRAMLLLFALAASLAAYFLVRELVGGLAGVVAAAAVGVAPAYAAFSARIVADVPALALALASLALAAASFSRPRPSAWMPAAAGALFALAVSVKLAAATALIPLIGLAIARRAPLRATLLLTGSGVLTAAVFAVVHVGSLSGLWEGVVTYHRDAARLADVPSTGANIFRLRTYFLDPETALFWLGLGGAIAFAAGISLRARGLLLPLWAWTVVAVVALIETRPLHDNHYTLLSTAVAIPAGASLGAAVARLRGGPIRAVTTSVIALVLAWGYAANGREIASQPRADGPDIGWAVQRLRETTRPTEWVAADRPIVAFLADRRLPGELVDTAHLRFATGSLTPEMVLEEIDQYAIRAVFAGREFRQHEDLLRQLQRRFQMERFGEVRIFVRR